ncbi:MAG: hypothetical protein V9E84_06655 [Trichococcus flocculiformis]
MAWKSAKGILITRKHWMLLLQALIVYCLFPRMGITKQEFVSTPMQWLRQNARASAFIAYTSLANAKESQNLFAPTHQFTEEAILKTGIPYSFLRNNWYLENEISGIQGVLAGAPWITSAENGKVGWALQQDYAEAAAAVLSGEGHENTIYELSGKVLTQEEIAAALGSVLGKEVTVQQVDDATYADIMAGCWCAGFRYPYPC